MPTSYSDIDNMFLSDIKDDSLLDFTVEEREEILNGLRKKAVTRFKACKKDLSDIDETLKQFNETLTDEEVLIIATCMRKYWYNDKIYNLDLLRQRLSSKDWKQSSQSEHLYRLTMLNQELDKEISRMIISYTLYAYNVSG